MTPRLLTSECSAHYPRLWHLVESVSDNKDVRKYPVMLDMVNFIQEFENWVFVSTDHLGQLLRAEPPKSVSKRTYGPLPIVGERLDFFGKHIEACMMRQEKIAKMLLEELNDWHGAILTRTAPENLPKYIGRKKCPICEQKSVMGYNNDLFCVNRNCQHTWTL